MARKTEYQDLEVKGSLFAEKIINPNEPADYLLRADGTSTSPYNPVNFPKGVTLRSSTEALTNAATVIELGNFELSQVPILLNKSLFVSNNTNVVKQSERLYELIDDETGDITVVSGIVSPVLGQTLRYTAINPSGSLDNLHLHILKTNARSAAYCVYIPQNLRFEKAVYKIEYYIYTNVAGDGDYNNKANYEWKTVFEKELNQRSVVIYPLGGTVFFTQEYTYTYTYNVRVSVKPTTKIYQYDIHIYDIDVLYYGGLSHNAPMYANRLINFDAKIEPTQTSTEFKSPQWLWQYLVQGVNWLRKNYLPASVLDTKTISDFSDLSTSQVNYFVDSTLTDSIFNQKVTFPSDWKGRKICLNLAPVTFQKDYDYSLKVVFANYMKATGARLFFENDLSAMVGVNTLIKIIIDNNVIIIEAYIEA